MSTGRPRVRDLALDAWRRLFHPLAPSVVAALIACAAAVAVFATTGQALAAQQATVDRINSASGRLITVTDAQGDAGLSPESVAAVLSLTGVEWAFAVGPVVDVHNAAFDGGASVPARPVFGDLPRPVVSSTGGTRLMPGQALAGPGLATRLGLGTGTGAVTSRTASTVVVGSFSAAEPLSALNDDVLFAPAADGPEPRVLTLWVSVADVSLLQDVARAVGQALIVREPGALTIETSGDLALLSNDIVAGLARSAQWTVTGLVAATAILIGAVQFGRVTATTRDIGRRRTLGASRNVIAVHVLLSAGMCATLGVVPGIAIGMAIDLLVSGALPSAAFTAGIGVLVVLAALGGALVPAVRAARLDPVSILRVP